MKKRIALILTFVMITASVTACQQALQGKSNNTQMPVSETDQVTENTTESVSDTESVSGESEETYKKELSFNPEEHIELCTSEIIAGSETYEIKAFLYDRIEEANGEVRGDAAFELFKNGERVNTIAPIIGYLGQRGKAYVKNKPENYFNVIRLEDSEVLAVTYPEDNGLMTTIFCTIKDGELVLMERYFTEEERKLLGMNNPHGHPITEKTCFNTTNKFTADGSSLVFELSSEISDNNSTFPAGEIPLVFDFENSTVKCGKDEYAGMVYYK